MWACWAVLLALDLRGLAADPGDRVVAGHGDRHADLDPLAGLRLLELVRRPVRALDLLVGRVPGVADRGPGRAVRDRRFQLLADLGLPGQLRPCTRCRRGWLPRPPRSARWCASPRCSRSCCPSPRPSRSCRRPRPGPGSRPRSLPRPGCRRPATGRRTWCPRPSCRPPRSASRRTSRRRRWSAPTWSSGRPRRRPRSGRTPWSRWCSRPSRR